MGLFSDINKKYTSVAKPLVEATPGLKWVGQSPTNFWTGFRVTKPMAAAAIGGIALYGAATGAKAGIDQKRQLASVNQQDVGPLAATKYEGTGNRSNLGATGDLVFGLHNKRRGR